VATANTAARVAVGVPGVSDAIIAWGAVLMKSASAHQQRGICSAFILLCRYYGKQRTQPSVNAIISNLGYQDCAYYFCEYTLGSAPILSIVWFPDCPIDGKNSSVGNLEVGLL
jgi:hypothetical protein